MRPWRHETAFGDVTGLHVSIQDGRAEVRIIDFGVVKAISQRLTDFTLVHFKDAQPIVRHKEVIGYRRGDARTKIDVDTGSGDLTIEPGA